MPVPIAARPRAKIRCKTRLQFLIGREVGATRETAADIVDCVAFALGFVMFHKFQGNRRGKLEKPCK